MSTHVGKHRHNTRSICQEAVSQHPQHAEVPQVSVRAASLEPSAEKGAPEEARCRARRVPQGAAET